MIETDQPIVDMLTLRRDLYLVMSILLADKELSKSDGMGIWTKPLHEIEVRRMVLWSATVVRGLLDLLESREDKFSGQNCGEYWSDFPRGKETSLTFRQTCNTVIHAKEILPYLPPQPDMMKAGKVVYAGRITVRSVFRQKTTRAQVDMLKFVEIATALITFFEESHHASR